MCGMTHVDIRPAPPDLNGSPVVTSGGEVRACIQSPTILRRQETPSDGLPSAHIETQTQPVEMAVVASKVGRPRETWPSPHAMVPLPVTGGECNGCPRRECTAPNAVGALRSEGERRAELAVVIREPVQPAVAVPRGRPSQVRRPLGFLRAVVVRVVSGTDEEGGHCVSRRPPRMHRHRPSR